MVGGPYDAIVEAASRKYGVPVGYIRSVMSVESGGDPAAVSRKGAGGLMQLMPATYQELAGKHGLGADRFDPVNNIHAGTAYLRENYDRFGGDWNKTLAAYNAGPGRVERGGPLPAETRAYVPKVQAGIRDEGAGVNFNDVLNRYAGGGSGAMTEDDLLELARNGQMPGQAAGGGLLADATNNWMDGLGGLLGGGQTASQPPGPSISQGQYQLAGAGNAVGQLAGVRNRRVGIGELLAALGGGMTQGTAAYGQQQRVQRADEREERNDQFNNLYRGAMARKALQPEGINPGDRFKVAGGQIFDAASQTWINKPGGAVTGGPFEGNSAEVQGVNQMIADGRLTVPQGAEWLASRGIPTGNGGYVMASPLAMGGGGAPGGAPGGAGGPAPSAGGVEAQPGVTTIRQGTAKEIPATMQTAMLGNVQGLRKVEDALSAVTAAPDATGVTAGLLNMLPGDTVNMVMPGGADARARLADIGSIVIHDRSGAAVTAAEFPRLKPFVPSPSDSAETVKMKLEKFRTEYLDILRDQAATYGPETGYQGNPVVQQTIRAGRAFRAQAPISGEDPNNPANTGQAAKVMRFDAQGNLVQ